MISFADTNMISSEYDIRVFTGSRWSVRGEVVPVRRVYGYRSILLSSLPLYMRAKVSLPFEREKKRKRERKKKRKMLLFHHDKDGVLVGFNWLPDLSLPLVSPLSLSGQPQLCVAAVRPPARPHLLPPPLLLLPLHVS